MTMDRFTLLSIHLIYEFYEKKFECLTKNNCNVSFNMIGYKLNGIS